MRKLVTLSIVVLAVGGGVATNTAQAEERKATVSTYNYIVKGLYCIHRYEGSWSDPHAPYYGGLQMDWNFMRAYGLSYLRRWGTADHWPVWAQVAAGVRGAMARGGFNPWPNTARMCGLPLYF